MSSDYQAIRQDNERRYGTDIARIGPMLLAERYDDRTHFIYELLQNTEDALRKRNNRSGSRSVRFELSANQLCVSHFGKPFDRKDVVSVCGIGISTKDLTAIGRFGLGFKSVFAMSYRPEIHSGEEHFAIENYVHPVATKGIHGNNGETIIKLPLKDSKCHGEIKTSLQRLGSDTLMFLREIEEIEWIIENGASGMYLRNQPDQFDDHVRRVTIIGKVDGHNDVKQDWLVFSKFMLSPVGEEVGNIEIAFSLKESQVVPVSRSPLVVFFPTAVETHLGIRVQGPYRTTPSRDNIPKHDDWNRKCVQTTAELLVEALIWLRDMKQLNIDILQCLPLESEKFDEDSMFTPIYDHVRAALARECLLPCFDDGYASANDVKLAHSQGLRELFDADQLTQIYGNGKKIRWLIDGITQDRTPLLKQYLLKELSIDEISPDKILPKLDSDFLKAQTNDWIKKMYEFLNGQHALLRKVVDLPLIRLTNGQHVQAYRDDQSQAFLPGNTKTDFPTVHPEVCDSDDSLAFLTALSLTEPDPIDDIIRNVLPKYRNEDVTVEDTDYDNDIQRILEAFSTDSNDNRIRLIEALREAYFVKAIDDGDGISYFSKPEKVYIAAERLKNLYLGVPNVLFVDDQYSSLRGEPVRELLEACGAIRYLRPIESHKLVPWNKRRELRKQAGHKEMDDIPGHIEDKEILGLDDLLDTFRKLSINERRNKAKLLWDELINLKNRRGEQVFSGKDSWTYSFRSFSIPFDAAFVCSLNEKKWIPNSEGELKVPSQVLFDSLEWKDDPFLLSKIKFKQPIVDQLEKAAGFEPGVLDLLKERGLISVKALAVLLGPLETDNSGENIDTPDSVPEAIKAILGDGPQPTPPSTYSEDTDPVSFQGYDAQRKNVNNSGQTGRRQFISYVAAHHNIQETVLGESEYQERIEIEEKAIEFILANEPEWQRTKPSNPGFDLYKSGENGEHKYWCEVKAMTGSLDKRSVGLSHTQFEYAREKGEDYWLYIVENTGTDQAHIIRIQNPAGRTRTFTFDHGWRSIAVAKTGEPTG